MCSNNRISLVGVRERPGCSVQHHHGVFNSNTTLAWEVNTGLDSEHHAVRQFLCGTSTDRRPLVNLKADAMSQPMCEVLRQARIPNDYSCLLVDH